MAKSKFTRQNLRSSILKQILFRVDFTGSTGGKETEQFVTDIKKNWVHQYFRKYNKLSNRTFKIDISKDGTVNKENQVQTIHRFSMCQIDNNVAIMDLSDDFAVLSINVDNEYEGSDRYLKCFSELIHLILDSDQFIELKRVGIRKYDHIFVGKDDNIDEILEDSLWMNYSDMGTCLKKEYKDFIIQNNTQINIFRTAENVKKDDHDLIRLIFDVDAYRVDKQLQRSILHSVDDICNMLKDDLNGHLFKIFINTFKESYLSQFYHE